MFDWAEIVARFMVKDRGITEAFHHTFGFPPSPIFTTDRAVRPIAVEFEIFGVMVKIVGASNNFA